MLLEAACTGSIGMQESGGIEGSSGREWVLGREILELPHAEAERSLVHLLKASHEKGKRKQGGKGREPWSVRDLNTPCN